MIEKVYRCDLCCAKCDKDVANNFLYGLSWSDFPVHGWQRAEVHEATHHICKTCFNSLKILDVTEKKKAEQ